MYIDGDDPTLEDLVIRRSTLPEAETVTHGAFTQYWLESYGGGVCLRNSDATLEGVEISSNYADRGGGR